MRICFFTSLSFLLFVSACTDPINIGSEVIEADGVIDVEFIDTLTLSSQTILADSSITFRQTDQNTYSGQTYLAGVMEDAVFGKSEAIAYFGVSLFSAFPDFSDLRVDSIVMSLSLDSLGQNGYEQALHEIELYRLTEPFEDLVEDTLYSNRSFEYEATPFYTVNREVSHSDSLMINAFTTDTVIGVSPQIRIPLDIDEWKTISSVANDTLIDNEKFISEVPGFALKSTPDESSIFGLDLLYAGSSSAASSNILIYYWPTDTTKNVLRLPLGKIRHNNFIHDYSGSELEANITADKPEFLFLESMGGTNIEFDLSSVLNLPEKILNQAVLEIAIEKEESPFEPISQIFAFYKNEDNDLVSVRDLSINNNNTVLFDGELNEVLSNGVTYDVYKMTLTNQIKDLLENEISTGKITLVANAKSQRSKRSKILGPAHPDYPPVLKLVITNP